MTQALGRLPSRRDVLRSLAGAGLGLGALRLPGIAAAKKKRKKRKKKTEQSTASCTPNCVERTCGNDGCGCSDPSVEGTKHCISDFVRPLVSCTSTTDCPLGAHCQDTLLGRVCVSVCQK